MNLPRKIKVASRASALAMQQTRTIIAWIAARHPALEFEIVEITTHGDRFQSTPITQMGENVERGIFNTALEEAVLDGRADLATCSFKDVESDLPAGLCAVSVGRREDPRDVLVTRHGKGLARLPPGAVLATSSPRRTSQLRAFRADLQFRPLRGNITTRVEKSVREFDGVILAAAGLLRLELQGHIQEYIDTGILLPAAAQAALGCEYLAGREDMAQIVAGIQDADTERCVRAEKALMIGLSGGCYAPIGVLATLRDGRFDMACRVVSQDGTQRVEERQTGTAAESSRVVQALVERLIARGAREIIDRTRASLLGQA
ncbi:MAG: hydroxymethylbilane synthase [Candidatus Lambdaproteobacteria bacterium]|nr:hydroxymethylbilane synthase [Candidatus Lambdaproteobacteria bacterium]